MKKTIVVIALVITFLATGCSHQHKFSSATCTSPETCTECGETQGEALGHEVEFGICGRCGEVVGADILNQIKALTTNSDNLKSAHAYYEAQKYNTCYEYLIELQSDYKKANEIAQRYPQMSKLSSLLTEVINMEFKKSNGSTLGDIIFMSTYVDYIELDLAVSRELKELNNQLLQ